MNKDRDDITIFYSMLVSGVPFTFSRYSDGETEILKNRKLTISEQEVFFRNKVLTYTYPLYDQKSFVPERDAALRADLKNSLTFEGKRYFKGIPGSHNSAEERDYYIELVGNNIENVTLADIFVNDNYRFFVRKFMRLIEASSNVIVICNENAKPKSFFGDHIYIPTNAFPDYQAVLNRTMRKLVQIPEGSVVLSSASSLSNILGHKLYLERPDCTFLDLGSAINSYLGLDTVTRVYHVGVHGPRNFRDVKMYVKHLLQSKGKMRW